MSVAPSSFVAVPSRNAPSFGLEAITSSVQVSSPTVAQLAGSPLSAIDVVSGVSPSDIASSTDALPSVPAPPASGSPIADPPSVDPILPDAVSQPTATPPSSEVVPQPAAPSAVDSLPLSPVPPSPTTAMKTTPQPPSKALSTNRSLAHTSAEQDVATSLETPIRRSLRNRRPRNDRVD